MKTAKRLFAVVLSVVMIAACFAGCSSTENEKYNDSVLIIGYTESAAPFLEVDKNGKATGFSADLWSAIFDTVKGDLKSYVFEQVEEGYELEKDGGFKDSTGKEYSAGLLMGAVSKNSGEFNETYSFSEPIITNRVIGITAKDSKIKNYANFEGARVIVVSDAANASFKKQKQIYDACKSVEEKTIDEALSALDSGKADVVITDEFNLNPTGKADSYTKLKGEIDVYEYVIACAKYSGWKDSINEAIRELKDEQYGDGNDFTPIVEKYFGYDASSFDYKTDGDE